MQKRREYRLKIEAVVTYEVSVVAPYDVDDAVELAEEMYENGDLLPWAVEEMSFENLRYIDVLDSQPYYED